MCRQGSCAGGFVPFCGACFAIAFIVLTHCCCSAVIVALSSDSFFIRSNESTITPTKRFNAKKAPINIHRIEKRAALGSKSSRIGA